MPPKYSMLERDLIPAADTDSRRLMVVLHGLGDSMEGYRWLPGALRLPWLNYLLVNAPTPYFGGFSWYDFDSDPAPGIEYSRKLLFSLLDDQRAAGFPTSETFLFGFSQGCLMTMEVGVRYPHQFAGLIGVSGYMHEPEELLRMASPVARNQRFLRTHGTGDQLIPFDRARLQVEPMQAAGFDIQWHAFDKEHTIAGESEISVIRQFIEAGVR